MSADMKIYAYGQGGKHRDTTSARIWRNATTAVADAISQEKPWMDRDIVILHAEDEVATYLRKAAR